MSVEPKPSAASNPDAPGAAAREAALRLVDAALQRRAGIDEGLSAPGFSSLNPRDRAWARALAATILRRKGPIDAILEPKLKRPPPERVIGILRLGIAQLLYRDTPAFAAVSTSVDMAEADKLSRPFKGLVNAVLRAVGREPPGEPSAESHVPPWLFARWTAAYGPQTAQAIAAAVPAEPPTDITLRDPAEGPALAAEVEGEVLSGGSVRTGRRGDITEWPGFEGGGWWIQDAAAAIPARLLDLKPGETALDLCAAPGGKTLQLAAAGAMVTAVDRSEQRLKRLSENLARTGLKAEVVAADAAAWDDARQYDAVLLDAPCSATGTFRRHPDVLWAARVAEIPKLAGVQTRLLDAAAERVKPGGRLVYCVCSLEPEEGEAQADAFLARHKDFTLRPVTAGEGGTPAAGLRADGTVRLTPALAEPAGGLDGFFIARFDRAG